MNLFNGFNEGIWVIFQVRVPKHFWRHYLNSYTRNRLERNGVLENMQKLPNLLFVSWAHNIESARRKLRISCVVVLSYFFVVVMKWLEELMYVFVWDWAHLIANYKINMCMQNKSTNTECMSNLTKTEKT